MKRGKKQAEVLGYKLTGKPDVKTEIDDATVKESTAGGLTYKKGKTVTVTHKTSGKELVIIDKPNVRKEYEKIGYVAEGIIKESQILKLANNVIKTKTEIKGMSLKVANHIIDIYNSYKKTHPQLAKKVANLPVNKGIKFAKMIVGEQKLTEIQTFPPFEIAKRMLKNKKFGNKWAKQIIRKFRGRGVSEKSLNKFLSGKFSKKDIGAIWGAEFEGKITEEKELPKVGDNVDIVTSSYYVQKIKKVSGDYVVVDNRKGKKAPAVILGKKKDKLGLYNASFKIKINNLKKSKYQHQSTIGINSWILKSVKGAIDGKDLEFDSIGRGKLFGYVNEAKLNEGVAETIIKQIPKRTLRYVGANTFVKGRSGEGEYMQFNVRGRKLKSGGRIQVIYSKKYDNYIVKSWMIRGSSATLKKQKDDIHVEVLGNVIEDLVG